MNSETLETTSQTIISSHQLKGNILADLFA